MVIANLQMGPNEIYLVLFFCKLVAFETTKWASASLPGMPFDIFTAK